MTGGVLASELVLASGFMLECIIGTTHIWCVSSLAGSSISKVSSRSGVGIVGGSIDSALALPFPRMHFFVLADDPDDDDISGRHLRIRMSFLANDTFL